MSVWSDIIVLGEIDGTCLCHFHSCPGPWTANPGQTVRFFQSWFPSASANLVAQGLESTGVKNKLCVLASTSNECLEQRPDQTRPLVSPSNHPTTIRLVYPGSSFKPKERTQLVSGIKALGQAPLDEPLVKPLGHDTTSFDQRGANDWLCRVNWSASWCHDPQ